jgi:hypothetical protein
MWKKIKFTLFIIGVILIMLGVPYLLGKPTNDVLKYSLYIGLIVFVIFFPTSSIKKLITKSN